MSLDKLGAIDAEITNAKSSFARLCYANKKIMVWDCFAAHGVGDLYRIESLFIICVPRQGDCLVLEITLFSRTMIQSTLRTSLENTSETFISISWTGRLKVLI